MKKFTSAWYDKLQETLELKKSALKQSDPFMVSRETQKTYADKKLKPIYENNEEAGTLKRTIIANTYFWLDSHDDVHLPGIFARSIDHKGLRIPHLHDHIFQLDAKVGKALEISEKDLSWRELGQGKTGLTQGLVLVSEIRKSYNEKIFNEYLNDEVNQHSVSMRYISLSLAVNNEEDFPEPFKVWQEVYPNLGNKAKADENGFFFAVKEAELSEISAVLAGSNELTPTLKEEIVIEKEKATMNELMKKYDFKINL
jgi:hypothetical protein